MTRIILVRHGQTDWNLQGRVQGTTDIPLNDTGRAQARDAGSRLWDLLSPTERVVLASSDLSRATETAEIIGAEIGVPVGIRSEALRERSYGQAEGMDLHMLSTQFPGISLDDAPGAEPWHSVKTRASAALRGIAAQTDADVIIVVSHGGLIRSLLREASEGAAPAPGARIPNGSLHEFALADDRLTLLSHESALPA